MLALPAGRAAVATVKPATNGTGAISWTCTGTLNPGASGTVTF